MFFVGYALVKLRDRCVRQGCCPGCCPCLAPACAHACAACCGASCCEPGVGCCPCCCYGFDSGGGGGRAGDLAGGINGGRGLSGSGNPLSSPVSDSTGLDPVSFCRARR